MDTHCLIEYAEALDAWLTVLLCVSWCVFNLLTFFPQPVCLFVHNRFKLIYCVQFKHKSINMYCTTKVNEKSTALSTGPCRYVVIAIIM